VVDIGNRVITKTLGPPVTGMVVCIYDVKFLCLHNPPMYTEYMKKYPNLNKLFGVLLDVPIRKLGLEKFSGPMKHMTYLSQPIETFLYYPEEELELFHDYINIESEEEKQYDDFDGFPGQI